MAESRSEKPWGLGPAALKKTRHGETHSVLGQRHQYLRETSRYVGQMTSATFRFSARTSFSVEWSSSSVERPSSVSKYVLTSSIFFPSHSSQPVPCSRSSGPHSRSLFQETAAHSHSAKLRAVACVFLLTAFHFKDEWSVRGANAIISLRCLTLFRRFED